jgi:hypothetical protein
MDPTEGCTRMDSLKQGVPCNGGQHGLEKHVCMAPVCNTGSREWDCMQAWAP